jgi:hypothetical protein
MILYFLVVTKERHLFLSLIIKKIMGSYILLFDNNVEIMINNSLLIASTALVFAISLVMIGSIAIPLKQVGLDVLTNEQQLLS